MSDTLRATAAHWSPIVKGMRFDRIVAMAMCVVLGVFHLYTAYAGTFYPYTQRAFAVMVGMMIVFLTIRVSGAGGAGDQSGEEAPSPPWYDWLLFLLCIPAFGFIAFQPDYLANRWSMTQIGAPRLWEQVLTCVGVVLLFEATRRLTGWVLVIGGILALAYAYWGEHIPIDYLSHRPFNFIQLVDYMYMTLEGVWGVAVGVAASYIVVFIIFGAFMEKAGAADFFVELVTAIAGHTRGGPGKVGIFSSALVGSVTGSSVANVYTTGQFTIPMMKRTGYQPKIAAAIEALASNGGQLMPPVMGAAAFIVAAYSGVPYQTIVIASILPATLYFLSLLWYVHLVSVKSGMKGMSAEEKPNLKDVLQRRGHLLLPLFGLIGMLVFGMSPLRAAFYAVALTIVVSWFREETRLTPKLVLGALQLGAQNSLMILSTCAVVGLIIGAFTMTGLALNASSAIIHFSGGIYLLVLLCVVLASLFLGMGMNTIAAFMLASILGVPALRELGIDNITANMFVFYAALLSHITPPVCLAVFAAAQIAGANIWATAFTAMKMGLVAYLMPFLIVGAPSLLLGTASGEFRLWPIAAAFAGAFLASASVVGWLAGRMNFLDRMLCGIGAALLIFPISEFSTSIQADWRLIGLAVGIAGVAVNVARYRINLERPLKGRREEI